MNKLSIVMELTDQQKEELIARAERAGTPLEQYVATASCLGSLYTIFSEPPDIVVALDNVNLDDSAYCDECGSLIDDEDEPSSPRPEMSTDFFSNEQLLAMMALYDGTNDIAGRSAIEVEIAREFRETKGIINREAVPAHFRHLIKDT